MIKKALALTVVLMLLAPLALASGPQGLRLAPGLQRRLVGLPPNVLQAERFLKQAETKFAELEALAQNDPAALKEKLLARHDALVKQAEELLANQATLPAKIATDLAAAQARALALATERAKEATNPEQAARRLALLTKRQARIQAHIAKHSAQIAARQVARAEQVLANAADIRSRIEKGEGLALIEEMREKRQEQRALRKENRPSKVKPGP